MLKNWRLEETGLGYDQKSVFSDNPKQKTGITRKFWYLRVFWLLSPILNFWKKFLSLGYATTQTWDTSNISQFLKS